jgi:hypothetical protein
MCSFSRKLNFNECSKYLPLPRLFFHGVFKTFYLINTAINIQNSGIVQSQAFLLHLFHHQFHKLWHLLTAGQLDNH